MLSKLKSTFKGLTQAFKQDKIMKLWEKGQYQKFASALKNQADYTSLKIDDYPFIYFLINKKDKYAVDALLSKVSYKNDILEDDKNPMTISPICYAFLEQDEDGDMVETLQKHGGSLSKVNQVGQNVLHLAAIYKRQSAFNKAVVKNIDWNLPDTFGNTPFHYAARVGSSEMIKTMIAARARKLQNKLYQYPIHMAIESGNLEAMNLLKGDITGTYPKFHPIHSASRSGNHEMVLQVLKIKPSSLNMKDYHGMTPLHHAVILQDALITRTLLESAGILINQADEYGNTPLHLALMNSSLQISQILLQHNANLDIVNEDFLSPADYGISSREKEIHSLLLKHQQKSLRVRQWSTIKY